jgi:myo-inositol 2-dehydrogenase / D-chiro-inositol 1-dehydrogenase
MGRPLSSSKKVGVGVIGVGAIGKVHAQNLARRVPNASLVAIADSNKAAADAVAGQTGTSNVYQDYNALLEDRAVEAVVVATPTFLKLEVVRAAAQAGKHIFCEKPMALTLKECDQFIEAADRAGIKFQVGYQRRFDPSYVRVKQAIDAGEIGTMLLLRSNTRDPPQKVAGWADPKVSGGIFLDTSSHDYDVIRWLSGSEATSVVADGMTTAYPELKQLGDKDTTMTIIRLSNGALAHVDACRVSVYGYDIRAEVVGTEGALFMDIGKNSDTHILKKAWESNEYSYWYQQRFDEAYRAELEGFAAAILGDSRPRVTARDGKAAVEIGLAARLSLEQQRSVTLPLA